MQNKHEQIHSHNEPTQRNATDRDDERGKILATKKKRSSTCKVLRKYINAFSSYSVNWFSKKKCVYTHPRKLKKKINTNFFVMLEIA